MKRPREGLDGLLDWFDLDLCPKICAELIAPLGTEKPMNRCLCNMFLHLNLFRPSQLCPNPRIGCILGRALDQHFHIQKRSPTPRETNPCPDNIPFPV